VTKSGCSTGLGDARSRLNSSFPQLNSTSGTSSAGSARARLPKDAFRFADPVGICVRVLETAGRPTAAVDRVDRLVDPVDPKPEGLTNRPHSLPTGAAPGTRSGSSRSEPTWKRSPTSTRTGSRPGVRRPTRSTSRSTTKRRRSSKPASVPNANCGREPRKAVSRRRSAARDAVDHGDKRVGVGGGVPGDRTAHAARAQQPVSAAYRPRPRAVGCHVPHGPRSLSGGNRRVPPGRVPDLPAITDPGTEAFE